MMILGTVELQLVSQAALSTPTLWLWLLSELLFASSLLLHFTLVVAVEQWAYFKADDSKALQNVPPSMSGGRLPCAKNSTKPSDYIMSNTSPPYHFLSSDPSAKSPKWKEGEPALSFQFWIAKAGEFFFVARKQKSESLAAEVGGWELRHATSLSTPPLIFLFVAVN